MLDLFTLMTTMGLQNELSDKEETKVIQPDQEDLEPQPTEPGLLQEAATTISDCFRTVEESVTNAATAVSQSEEVAAISGFMDNALNGGDPAEGNPFVIDLTLPPPPIKVGGKKA